MVRDVIRQYILPIPQQVYGRITILNIVWRWWWIVIVIAVVVLPIHSSPLMLP